MPDKQYLVKLYRLASEPAVTGTDQDTNYAYFLIPETAEVPDLNTLVTPHRSGFARWYGSIAGAWSSDCFPDTPPTTDPKDPVFKVSYAPPGFVVGETYNLILDTANYNDVVTIGSGTSINRFLFSAYPSWMTVTNVYGEPTKTRLTGIVPAGTTSIPLSITIEAIEPSGNPHTATKSFSVGAKVLDDPYMGYIYSDGNLQLFMGPDSATNPWLTISTAPGGFTDRTRQQVPEFEANNAPVLAVLGGKPSYWRKLLPTPPAGSYAGLYEINGKAKNFSFTFAGVASSGSITLTDAPTTPGGGSPIDPPIISNKPTIYLRAGQQWSELVTGYTLGLGQKLINAEVVGSALSGYSITKVGDEKFQEAYNVPANQVNDNKAVLVKITQTDGQSATYQRNFGVVTIPYNVRILHESATVDIVQIGPTFSDATVKVEGPSGWGGAIGATSPQGVQPFEKWDYTIPGATFAGRYRGYRFNLPGQYIFTFVQDGVTQYASMVVGAGGFAGFLGLELSPTKPAVSVAPQYYLAKSLATLNEGGVLYLTLMQHVTGQPTDTPVSGGEYLATNAKTGTTVNSVTGQVKVDANSIVGDGYTLNVQAKLNAVVVVNDYLTINDTSPSAYIAPAFLDYAWSKNNPPTTLSRLDVWIKTNGGTGNLEMAQSVSGPSSDYTIPKSGYSGFNTGSYGSGYTLQIPIDNAISRAVYTLYVRRVGTTADLATITLPAFPDSGSVARVAYWSADSTPIPSPVTGFPGDDLDYVPNSYANVQRNSWDSTLPDFAVFEAYDFQADDTFMIRYTTSRDIGQGVVTANMYLVNLATKRFSKRKVYNMRRFNPIGLTHYGAVRGPNDYTIDPTVNCTQQIYIE